MNKFKIHPRTLEPVIYLIDLFAGAGGTTSAANFSSNKIRVIYCINHDPVAIRSHAENHPDCIHTVEDIRTANLKEISKIVEKLRQENPNCKIAIWGSLECTHFSKAKGGQSRDGDSRSLAEHMFRYEDAIKPDFFWFENVREFLTWGPLRIKEGKNSTKLYSELDWDPKKESYIMVPDKCRKSEEYNLWVDEFKNRGFHYDYKLLNSADYGGYTIRTRYFGQFSKVPEFIAWPHKTHSKTWKKDNLKPYKAVRDVLDLDDQGSSIFNRKKPLADATYERIYAGLVKFVANGDDSFIQKYFSGRPEGKVISLNVPAGAIKTVDGHSIVFTHRYNGGNPEQKVNDLDKPMGAITCVNRHALVNCVFLSGYYGTLTLGDINNPCGTLTTKDRYTKINVNFMDQQYGNGLPSSVDSPCGSLTTNPKQNLISVNHWLVNPQYSSKESSIEDPCFTLIARTDKSPPYLLTSEHADPENLCIPIYDYDTKIVRKIKYFMIIYQISDIKQRMLNLMEMKQIQGFPKNYVLHGTQQEQKRGIGNSVEVTVGKALFKAITFNLRLKTNFNPEWERKIA